jgi:hypothetical protein
LGSRAGTAVPARDGAKRLIWLPEIVAALKSGRATTGLSCGSSPPTCGHAWRPQPRDVESGEADPARGDTQQAHNSLAERRLAHAVAADDGQRFRAERQRYALQDMDLLAMTTSLTKTVTAA